MYQPTEQDLNWARWLLSMVRDGGSHTFPPTGQRYNFSHANKQILWVNPDHEDLHNPQPMQEPWANRRETHWRTQTVFWALGYTVLPIVPSEENEESHE